VQEFRGLDPTRIGRLHGVARAALDGALDPQRLAALDAAEAFKEVQKIPGIGPTYGTLIVVRATGATDALTFNEPRLGSYAARFYNTGPEPLAAPQLEAIAERWRPFRTWAAVLIRVAGDSGVKVTQP